MLANSAAGSLMATVACPNSREAAGELIGHQLHAVADAEHGPADGVDGRIAFRRAGVRDALRPAGQDDADRIARADLVHRRLRRPDFRVHPQLA
jgi:hypothetical protein